MFARELARASWDSLFKQPFTARPNGQTIGVSGACFACDTDLARRTPIVREVFCEHPTKGCVRISFPGEVVRACFSAQWTVAVRLEGRHRFLVDSVDGLLVQ